MPRNRRFGSVANVLLSKSREAALSAVQIYNNPLIRFKSESYIVLMIIAWTYLLHAYYRKNKVEYRHYEKKEKTRRFRRTKDNGYRYWDLAKCLKAKESPIDRATANNLRFLNGLRHEIEHEMSSKLDDYLGGRYQACAVNYNRCAKDLFGERHGIEDFLAHSIQFLPITYEQLDRTESENLAGISSGVRNYIAHFEQSMDQDDLHSDKYSYGLIFTKKTVNHPGQADRAIVFIDPDTELAQAINKQFWVTKDTERKKYLPGEIVRKMNELGYIRFRIYEHTKLWKSHGGKNPANGYGVEIGGRWFWYEKWLELVEKHCRDYQDRYRANGYLQ